MSKFERIHVRDNEAIELCHMSDGRLELSVVVKSIGVIGAIVLDRDTEKALSVALQLRERARLERRRRQG